MAKSENVVPSLMTNELLIAASGRGQRVEIGAAEVSIDGKAIAASLSRLGEDVYELSAGLEKHVVVVVERRDDGITITVDGCRHDLQIDDSTSLLRKSVETGAHGSTGTVEIKSPMPGLVTRILVSPGDMVVKGQGLLILEAMKMENELRAASDGRIVTVSAAVQTPVEKGEVLLRIQYE